MVHIVSVFMLFYYVLRGFRHVGGLSFHFSLILKVLKYFCINRGDERFFLQFEVIINVLVGFEYLCYGSTALINVFALSQFQI